MPKFLRATYFALLVALPAVLFFSYYPIISLGANASMNFELSLPLIWLVLFDLVAFANFALLIKQHKDSAQRRKIKKIGKRNFMMFFESIKTRARAPERSSRKTVIKFLLFLLFPIYATLSVFWSENPLRALLTSGILWLLFFAIFAIIRLSPLLEPPSRLKIWLIRVFFASTAVVCLFCFLQSLLDSCGLSRETTLLCAGCTYRSFGFPHPNGFAIEPQFMGNLLLAPTLLALYLLCKPEQLRSANVAKLARATAPSTPVASTKPEQISKTEHVEPEQRLITFPHLRKTPAKLALVICAILFSTTLFFTFSRGAIYSYALGLLILIIFALCRHTFRPALIVIPVATFLLSLGLQGAFAHFGPTSETFTSAVTKSIHQLSLGLIDLRPQPNSEPKADTSETTNTTTEDSVSESSKGANNQADAGLDATRRERPESITAPAEESLTPVFDGYVEDSTNVRLGLSSTALATWSHSPRTILFGVGLGGAGIAMHQFDSVKNPSPKEIVQNQPISLLLETGLLGVALLLVIFYLAFGPRSPFWTHPALPLLISLIAAYLVSLQFFAGLPNALHIYLFPPLFYYLFLPNQPKSVKITKSFTNSLPKTQNKHKHS